MISISKHSIAPVYLVDPDLGFEFAPETYCKNLFFGCLGPFFTVPARTCSPGKKKKKATNNNTFRRFRMIARCPNPEAAKQT